MVDIRRAGPEDWQQLRAVRLQSLEADPSAFGSSLNRELPYGKDDWQGWIQRSTVLLAIDPADGTAVGMGTVRPLDDPRTGEINAMWVSPPLRGTGLGRQLLTALLDAARAEGRQQVQLWVTSGNDGAIQLYERAGFVHTGRTEPLLSDPQLSVLEYVLGLG